MSRLDDIDAKLAEAAEARLGSKFPGLSSYAKVFVAGVQDAKIADEAARLPECQLLLGRQRELGPSGRPLGVDQLLGILRAARRDLARRLEAACRAWGSTKPWHVIVAAFAGMVNRGGTDLDVDAAVWRAGESLDWLEALTNAKSRKRSRYDELDAEIAARADEALRLAEAARDGATALAGSVAQSLVPAVEAILAIRRVDATALRADPWKAMEKERRPRAQRALLVAMLVEALRRVVQHDAAEGLELLRATGDCAARVAKASRASSKSSESSESSRARG